MSPKSIAIPFIPLLFAGVDVFPIQALAVLIGLDIITGIASAVTRRDPKKGGKIRGTQAFKSSTAIIGVLRKCMYLLVPIAIGVAGKASSTDLNEIANYAMLTIALFEILSIFGNIASIGKEEKIPELDVIGLLYYWAADKVQVLTGLKIK